MREQYRAARERLRRSENGQWWPMYDDQADFLIDKATIYDAEHDATPATVEWCKQLGEFYADGIGTRVCMDGGTTIWELQPGVMLTIHGLDVLANPTRGQVLSLMRVFGEGK